MLCCRKDVASVYEAYEDGRLRVEVEAVSRGSCAIKAWRWAVSWITRFCPSSIKNTVAIAKAQELSQVILAGGSKLRPIAPFSTLGGHQYITTDPRVMNLILRQYRTSKTGFFDDRENARLFCKFLKRLWPSSFASEQSIAYAKEAMPLTAHCEKNHSLRLPLLRRFPRSNLLDPAMNTLAEDFVSTFEGNVDGRELSRCYFVTVLMRRVFEFQCTAERIQEIAWAVDSVGVAMNGSVLHKPEDARIEDAIAIFRAAVDQIAEADGEFVQSLRTLNLDRNQIRAYLFVLFFAGMETSASLSNYLLAVLASDLTLQDRIASEEVGIVRKVVEEGLRLHPPAYIMGRQVRADRDLLFTFSREGAVIERVRVLAGETIIMSPYGAAGRCVHPLTFNADRDDIRQRDIKPFGGGVHSCPGQYLAFSEISYLVTHICRAYRVSSRGAVDLSQSGVFTLKVPSAQLVLSSRI